MHVKPETTVGSGGGSDAVGLRLIIGYKFLKAVGELILGVAVLVFLSAGLPDEVRELARRVREHATAAWSVDLAEWLTNAATRRNLRVVAVASLLDAVWSCFEGWALYRGYAWSGWLVIVATSSLFPFEVIAIARHVRAGRVALMALNVLIVAYLVRRQLGRRAGELPAGPG